MVPRSWLAVEPALAWYAGGRPGGVVAAPGLPPGCSAYPSAVALLSGGSLLAVGGSGHVAVRSARTGALLALLPERPGAVCALAVDLSDDDVLYTATAAGRHVHAWDMGAVEERFGGARPEGEAAAAAAAGRTEVQRLAPVGVLAHGFTRLHALCVSADGALLHGCGESAARAGLTLRAWRTDAGGALARDVPLDIESPNDDDDHGSTVNGAALLLSGERDVAVVPCLEIDRRRFRHVGHAWAAEAVAAGSTRQLGTDALGDWHVADVPTTPPASFAWLAAAAARCRGDAARALYSGFSHAAVRADGAAIYAADTGGAVVLHAPCDAAHGDVTCARLDPRRLLAADDGGGGGGFGGGGAMAVVRLALSADERTLFAAHADGGCTAWRVQLPPGGWQPLWHGRYPAPFRACVRAALLVFYRCLPGAPPITAGELAVSVAKALAEQLFPRGATPPLPRPVPMMHPLQWQIYNLAPWARTNSGFSLRSSAQPGPLPWDAELPADDVTDAATYYDEEL